MAPPTYDDDGLPATPPLLVVNGGAALPPVKSKQYEVGGKLGFGRFNAVLALFQIDKPNSFVDPVTIIYCNYGTTSETRRVGHECVSQCRSRWSGWHKKKK